MKRFQELVWKELSYRAIIEKSTEESSTSGTVPYMILQVLIHLGSLTIGAHNLASTKVSVTSEETKEKYKQLISDDLGRILLWIAGICSAVGLSLPRVGEESIENFREDK